MKRLFDWLSWDFDARIKHIWFTPFVLITWHEEAWFSSLDVRFYGLNEPFGERRIQ